MLLTHAASSSSSTQKLPAIEPYFPSYCSHTSPATAACTCACSHRRGSQVATTRAATYRNSKRPVDLQAPSHSIYPTTACRCSACPPCTAPCEELA